MTKASDNVFPKLIGSEGAAPATPSAATAILYVKADGLWYSKDDAGAETLVSGGGSGAVATDAIWDAAGDTVVGSGANTAVKRMNNDGAAVAPTVNEDSGDGYAIGSRWLDTTADIEYVCTDATVGAAVWRQTSHGVWTTYTPTWASGGVTAIGDGILTGRHKLLDSKTGLLHVRFQWGTTTSDSGTGAWTFSLPSGWTAGSVVHNILAGHISDSGTDHKVASAKVAASGTTISEVYPEGGNVVTKTAPMTWTNNDQLNLSGIMELA